MIENTAFSYSSKWNRHHPLGNADQYEVYRCLVFKGSEGLGLTVTAKEGGPFTFIEERLKGPLGGGLPKRVDYKVEGLSEEESEQRPNGSANFIVRKRVRQYFNKVEGSACFCEALSPLCAWGLWECHVVGERRAFRRSQEMAATLWPQGG